MIQSHPIRLCNHFRRANLRSDYPNLCWDLSLGWNVSTVGPASWLEGIADRQRSQKSLYVQCAACEVQDCVVHTNRQCERAYYKSTWRKFWVRWIKHGGGEPSHLPLRAKVFFSTTKNHFPRFSFLDSKKSLLFGVPSVLHIEISVPHISFNFFEPKNFDVIWFFGFRKGTFAPSVLIILLLVYVTL